MVAYNATNITLPLGFSATASDPDPIYDRFGLYTEQSFFQLLVYNHGQNLNPRRLSQVASANREFRFPPELLKAAITAGSIGQGAPNPDPFK